MKLISALFHDNVDQSKHSSSSPTSTTSDPRSNMVDDVRELDGAAANHNDNTPTPRMQKLEKTLLHTLTPEEMRLKSEQIRVHKDEKEMSDRMSTWRARHQHAPNDGDHSDKQSPPSKITTQSNHHHLRFASTKTIVAVTTSVGPSSGDSQYVATQEAPSATTVNHGVTEAEKSAILGAIEKQVESSIKLEGAEVVEHTAKEDPDVGEDPFAKKPGPENQVSAEEQEAEKEAEKKEEEKEQENLDGPENGGDGEETPIYKWYKWWNLQNWKENTLQMMVNSPTHGQQNTDVGGPKTATNTHGDDNFAAQMADASSGVVAIEGEGTGKGGGDGAAKCTDCTPFPAWTRKDNWIRTDANFAPEGLVPPTEQDQKEIEDAMKKQLPGKAELNDPLDPARTKQLQAAANIGAGPVQNSLDNAMNQGVDAAG